MMRASYIVVESLKHLASGRVFVAPRKKNDDQGVPYITYQIISKTPVNTLDGYSGHDRVRVQINVYAHTYNDCELLMARVKRSFNRSHGAPEIGSVTAHQYESDTDLNQLSCDVFLSEFIDYGG